MKLKSSFIKFLKNVGCGFTTLLAAVAIPNLSFIGSSLIGQQIALATGSLYLGLGIWFGLFLLFTSIGITMLQEFIKNLPFED